MRTRVPHWTPYSLEAGDDLLVAGHLRVKTLDGDPAVGVLVLGLVDDAHAALGELADDAIAGFEEGIGGHGEWMG